MAVISPHPGRGHGWVGAQEEGTPSSRRMAEQVNALQPDVVAVTGNHEYYHGGPAWAAEVARLGLTVLQNEHRVVERDGARLTIAGVTDHDAGHIIPSHASRPELALHGSPRGVLRLLLAHQPRSALRVAEAGVMVDLQLSGHTHGGQVFPFMFFIKLQQPVVRGLATIAGGQAIGGRRWPWYPPRGHYAPCASVEYPPRIRDFPC